MSQSGIYFLINRTTLKYYVGSSKHLNIRISEHIRHLSNNAHYNKHLQRAFNKYGKEGFTIKLVEVPVKLIRKIEQSILNNLEPKYNIAKEACFPTPLKGKDHKDADTTLYNFYHCEFGHFYCDCFTLRAKFKDLTRAGLRDLILNRSYTHRGWRLASNQKEYDEYDLIFKKKRTKCLDEKIYRLSHPKYGQVTGNRQKLALETQLSKPSISRLINNKAKSAKGWRLIN